MGRVRKVGRTSGSMSGSVGADSAPGGSALFTVGVFSLAGRACSPELAAGGAVAPRASASVGSSCVWSQGAGTTRSARSFGLA